VVFLGEVALQDAEETDDQHQGTHGDVDTVEAGQEEEQAAVDACFQSQAQITVCMNILVTLQAEEDQTEQDSDALEQDQSCHAHR
jgi:hypothetical protein